MNTHIFLVGSLVLSSVVTINSLPMSIILLNGSFPVDISEDIDIPEINHGVDDILPSPLRSAISNGDRRWMSPVPYVLDKSLEMNAKGVILKAFDQFRLKSCIDFKPRDSEEYYISVEKGNGCYSFIGKVQKKQTVSIGNRCDRLAIVEHELLHALGFFHEQSRYDRDDYVTIQFANISPGVENNFAKGTKQTQNTQGVPYDYMSVMHYGQKAFSKNGDLTIITKDPAFQNLIGQREGMSPSDVLKLNRLYECTSTISFMTHCDFNDKSMCQMSRCSNSGNDWERLEKVSSGPSSDHTTLSTDRPGSGYFMHASTASGKAGDSAWLETLKMKPKRTCHIQCLQFYYYHSGGVSDELNIYLREFENDKDAKGKLQLMETIKGPQTSHWKLQHVPLDASKAFQVEFEARKGGDPSTGGFSIDDINLSETVCPHNTFEVPNIEKYFPKGINLFGPRQYSKTGYAYRSGVTVTPVSVAQVMQMTSGKNDDKLKWPMPETQLTFQLLDQRPNIQQQQSIEFSVTTDPSATIDGKFIWEDPSKIGQKVVENGETFYAGFKISTSSIPLEKVKRREYLKGGKVIFTLSFDDISPLSSGNTLPCPKLMFKPPVKNNEGPCATRIKPTTLPPPTTTEDNSIFGFAPGMTASPVLALLAASMILTY